MNRISPTSCAVQLAAAQARRRAARTLQEKQAILAEITALQRLMY